MNNKIKKSEAYLNSVLEKKPFFSTPKDYFNTIEEDFFVALVEDNIPKKDVFSTPDSYFNTLENTILKKVKSKEKTTKVISLKQRFYKIIPTIVAASIILFISINFYTSSNFEVRFDDLAQSDIEDWILDNSLEMTSQDITTIIPLVNMNIDNLSFPEINNDDIEEYIIYDKNTILLNEIK